MTGLTTPKSKIRRSGCHADNSSSATKPAPKKRAKGTKGRKALKYTASKNRRARRKPSPRYLLAALGQLQLKGPLRTWRKAVLQQMHQRRQALHLRTTRAVLSPTLQLPHRPLSAKQRAKQARLSSVPALRTPLPNMLRIKLKTRSNTKKRALTPLAQPMLLQRATQDLLPPVTKLARMETSLRQAPKRQQRRRHPPKRQQHRRHPPKRQQRRRPKRQHRRHPPKRQQHRSHPGKKALRANRPAQGSSERQLLVECVKRATTSDQLQSACAEPLNQPQKAADEKQTGPTKDSKADEHELKERLRRESHARYMRFSRSLQSNLKSDMKSALLLWNVCPMCVTTLLTTKDLGTYVT